MTARDGSPVSRVVCGESGGPSTVAQGDVQTVASSTPHPPVMFCEACEVRHASRGGWLCDTCRTQLCDDRLRPALLNLCGLFLRGSKKAFT